MRTHGPRRRWHWVTTAAGPTTIVQVPHFKCDPGQRPCLINALSCVWCKTCRALRAIARSLVPPPRRVETRRRVGAPWFQNGRNRRHGIVSPARRSDVRRDVIGQTSSRISRGIPVGYSRSRKDSASAVASCVGHRQWRDLATVITRLLACCFSVEGYWCLCLRFDPGDVPWHCLDVSIHRRCEDEPSRPVFDTF